MKRLGERIKQKRENMRIQLGELASRVGISASALSQIEKAKAFPSIVTLKKIADKLHTTVGELIGEHEALSKNPVMRYDDVSFVEENDSGCSSYLLSNHGSNKQMDTLLLKLKAGSDSTGILNPHPGQSFLFVLEGQVCIDLDGTKYDLEQNDSFYLNSSRPHKIFNNSQQVSRLIVVSTPPTG